MSGPAKIEVLMTTDTVGGVWTYSCALASALVASGVGVCLVTLGPRATADQRSMLSDPRIRLIETDLALEWQDPEGQDTAKARDVLVDLEAELRPDVVHLNGFREAAFGWRAPSVVVAHSCVNSWALACRDRSWLADEKWQRYSRSVAHGLGRADAWVSPTRAFRDVISELYQPRSAGVVIHNGVAPNDTPSKLKQDFVFAAGRLWDRAKNIAVLAEAADGLPWPVLVAGPGDDTLGSSATWLGHLPHGAVLEQMQRAAVFASPALYEPFGLSVLEAAAAGCALVLSDIPTFRELWNGAALFVDPADKTALSRALAELCNDRDQRMALQRAAYERSFDYSLSGMAGAYLQLYEQLLRSVGPVRMEAHA